MNYDTVRLMLFGRKGNICFEKKDYQGAKDFYTLAIQFDPLSPAYYSNRSAASARMLEWESAAEDARLCIGNDRTFVKGYYRLAIAYQGLAKITDAVEILTNGLELDPRNENLLALKCKLVSDVKHQGHVDTLREESIKHESSAFRDRAAYYVSQDNFPKAIKFCDKAISVDPLEMSSYTLKVEALLSLGQFCEAERTAASGLAIDPENELLRMKQAEARQNFIYRDQKIQMNVPAEVQKAQALHSVPELLRGMVEFSDRKPARKLSKEDNKRIAVLMIIQEKVQRSNLFEMNGDIASALKGYTEAANKGCTISMSALGRIYFNGDGVPVDHKLGLYWLKKCVDHGPSEMSILLNGGTDYALSSAHGLLGLAYRHGIFVERNLDLAQKHLTIGAEGGEPEVMNNLGVFLNCGERRDVTAAVHWFKKSAERNYPVGMLNLAQNLLETASSKDAISEAEKWLLKAASLGEDRAQKMLAGIHRKRGDFTQAVETLKLVVDKEVVLFGKATTGSLIDLAEEIFRAQKQEDKLLSDEKLLNRLELTDRETKACAYLRAAISREDPSEAAGIVLGEFLLQKKRLGESLEIFNTIAQRCRSSKGFLQCGIILLKSGALFDSAQAMKNLLKASSLGSSEADLIIRQRQRAEPPESEQRGGDSLKGAPLDQKDLESLFAIRSGILAQLPRHVPTPHSQHISGELILQDTLKCYDTMKAYVSVNPGSYSGWAVYLSLLHFVLFKVDWKSGKEESAVDNMFLALMFEEKCVCLDQDIAKKIQKKLEHRVDFKALSILSILGGSDPHRSYRTLTKLLTVHSSTDPMFCRLIPRFLQLRGGFGCFIGRFSDAVTDFEQAERLITSDSTTSIWPYEPVISRAKVEVLRNHIILDAQLNIGRSLMMLLQTCTSNEFGPTQKRAVGYIENFIDNAPKDSKLFVTAHFDLLECSIPGILADPKKIEGIIKRGEHYVDKCIPVFEVFTSTNFPKMGQAKILLAQSHLMKTKTPEIEKSLSTRCSGCASQHSVMKPLRVCSSCHRTVYCSKKCQTEDWGKHKLDCKKWSAAAVESP